MTTLKDEMYEIARRARKNKLDEARMWALSYLPWVRDTIAATAEKGETSCSIRMEIKGTWRSLWRSKPATSCQVETMASMIRELGFEAFPRLGNRMQFEPIDSQVYEIQIFWS
jgi:hypothetical protein